MEVTPPGYYPAQGDPAGTVRYWDGTEWSPEPMPPPPGYDPNHRPGDERFATVGVRIGATLLDGVVGLVLSVPFLFSYLGDVIDDIDAGGDGTAVEIPPSLYLAGLLVSAVSIACVARFGGSPGKLMVGLRITTEDGATTPPGIAKATMRQLPQIAGAIPVIGTFIAIGFSVTSLVFVSTDPERRSAYDRLAGTRVIHRRHR
ncbi:MAG: RDD family protein [Acidimicrobiales bacterium]